MKSMLSWQLKQAGKRRAEIRHSYQIENFGLIPETVDDAFAPYLDFIASRGIR